MTNRRFTEEEKRILRENPYTYRVTDFMILFTLEFKEVFWKRYQAGLSPVAIMIEMGYDPSMLGGAGGMGGLPGGMDLSSLKGMDMKKLQEMAKRFR